MLDIPVVHTATVAQVRDDFTVDRAMIKDDGGPITFRWAFPRGTLASRMSAVELAEFVLNHMPHIIPLLSGYPRIQKEFQAILNLFILMPYRALDEVLPWVQSVTREGPDDVIIMDLNAKATPGRKIKVFY